MYDKLDVMITAVETAPSLSCGFGGKTPGFAGCKESLSVF